MVTNLSPEFIGLAGGGFGPHPRSECGGSSSSGPRYFAQAMGADQSPGEDHNLAFPIAKGGIGTYYHMMVSCAQLNQELRTVRRLVTFHLLVKGS